MESLFTVKAKNTQINKELKNNAEIKKALIDAGFVSGGEENE